MSAKPIFLLLLHLFAWLGCSLGQHSGYSLQAAVDELHRREAAKYPLNAPPATQQRYGGGAFLGGSPQEQDYWDEDADGYNGNSNNNRNRHRLNKILAKYLERENYDADHGGLTLGPFGGYEFDEDNNNLFLNYPEEKKRASYFRERDNKWANGAADNASPSIFRERDNENPNGGDHAELTDQFLREIEESQELEREARYKDALRRLWEKYQQQENELDGNLHEEYKRMIGSSPNYYMGPLMQKKRSYPVLPWLPYSSRKKRVPAMQPSVKRSPSEGSNFGKTDDKVAWELSELFGGPVSEDKKKRSTDEQVNNVGTTSAPEKPTTTTTMKTHMRLETASTAKENDTKTVPEHEHQEHAGHEGHKHAKVQTQNRSQASHQQRKRSYHHAHGESHEDCDESEEHEEHEHEEHEEEEDEDEHELEDIDEDEEEERKKKRDVTTAGLGGTNRRSNWEVITEDQILPEDQGNSYRRKKSVNWSKYFGLDRKKKFYIRDQDILKKKRSTNEEDNELEEKKRDLNPDKLDNMDKKLQAIEDMIIDDTIKYTGAHEGIANPDEIRRLKDHVLSRLATAYSLEKMRRALDKLRQSVDNENHFLHNVIENESKSEENEAFEQQKRLSVKKEKVQFDSSQHLGLPPNIEKSKELHSNTMSNTNENSGHSNHSDNSDNDNEDMKKKKKKRTNSYLRYPEVPNDFVYFEPELGAGHYESLNDAYLGNKNYVIGSNQCPLIESMAERCRNVDLLSGDIHQELLPICGVHQICYLCGTSQIACDYQYLAEADVICGHSNDCQAAARSVLMILRGTPGTQLGPKECLKNPCLYSAMREIGL